MARMKTFAIYAVLIIATYFIVDFLSFWYIKTTYNIITQYQIELDNPIVTIKDAQATAINGYIKGTYRNVSQEKIEEQMIKIEMFSENEIEVGTKYLIVEDLQPNQEQGFQIKFNYNEVTHFKVSLADEKDEIKQDEMKSDPERGIAVLFSAIILLYFM